MFPRIPRRELLQLAVLPATAAAQPWKPAVLSERQDRAVDALAELIIPRTETPGARDAQVHRYIDRMLAEGMLEAERAAFLSGLTVFDDVPADRYESMLIELSRGDRGEDGRRFFRQLKDLVIRGYYTSREGLMQELEYKGNGAFEQYPGCTHPEHKG